MSGWGLPADSLLVVEDYILVTGVGSFCASWNEQVRSCKY